MAPRSHPPRGTEQAGQHDGDRAGECLLVGLREDAGEPLARLGGRLRADGDGAVVDTLVPLGEALALLGEHGVDGITAIDRTVSVPGGAIVAWRPKPVHRQANGRVHLNFSSATSVTAAVLD
jgi:hypothetical protein